MRQNPNDNVTNEKKNMVTYIKNDFNRVRSELEFQ